MGRGCLRWGGCMEVSFCSIWWKVERGKFVSAEWDEGQSPGVIFLLLLSSRNSPSLFLDCFEIYFKHQC